MGRLPAEQPRCDAPVARHVGSPRRETEMGEDLALGYTIHIAETEEKAIQEARGFFEENMKMFAPWDLWAGYPRCRSGRWKTPDAHVRPGLPTLEDGIRAGSWLCGPPELITEKLQTIQEQCPGLDQINVGSVIGTPQSVILEQLEAFGKDVMPKIKSRA